jgi:hypothetical protein
MLLRRRVLRKINVYPLGSTEIGIHGNVYHWESLQAIKIGRVYI